VTRAGTRRNPAELASSPRIEIEAISRNAIRERRELLDLIGVADSHGGGVGRVLLNLQREHRSDLAPLLPHLQEMRADHASAVSSCNRQDKGKDGRLAHWDRPRSGTYRVAAATCDGARASLASACARRLRMYSSASSVCRLTYSIPAGAPSCIAGWQNSQFM
jgi:hypothetical protein